MLLARWNQDMSQRQAIWAFRNCDLFLEVAGLQSQGGSLPAAGSPQVTKAGQKPPPPFPASPLFLQRLLVPSHRDLGVQLRLHIESLAGS